MVDVETLDVVALKVAEVLPAAMVTEPGTETTPLLLANVTTAPPDGAELLSVTVPVAELPPVRLAGLRLTDASVTTTTGLMVRVAVLLALR